MTDDSRPTGPTAMEALAERTKRFFVDVLAEWIKLPIAEVGAWMRRRVTLYVVGLLLLCVAVVFLLVGGVQGLQALKVPPWATYLGVGALAGVAGLVVMKQK
jgi:hypothetical protein